MSRLLALRPSEHFTWREVTRSATAEREGINNSTMTLEQRAAAVWTAWMMELVRDLLGRQPIRVTSWWRSKALNDILPGASDTSDHLTGFAIDFARPGMTGYGIAKAIVDSDIPFDELVYYPGEDRIHISFKPHGRREVLTKRKGGGYKEGLVNARI